MTEFQLDVNEKGFREYGVQVSFDEAFYGSLLDSLIPVINEEDTPKVNLSPAAIWGMSAIQKVIHAFGRNYVYLPDYNYDTSLRAIDVRADPDALETNKLLLKGTRRWAGHLNGELAAFNNRLHKERHVRRFTNCMMIGAGVFAGLDAGGGESSAFIGGGIGVVAALGKDIIVDSVRSPHNRNPQAFSKDPAVIAKYGSIISYEPL